MVCRSNFFSNSSNVEMIIEEMEKKCSFQREKKFSKLLAAKTSITRNCFTLPDTEDSKLFSIEIL